MSDLCPEFEEYLKWYDNEVLPKLKEFSKHALHCLECQKLILESTNSVGLRMAIASEDTLIEGIERLAE